MLTPPAAPQEKPEAAVRATAEKRQNARANQKRRQSAVAAKAEAAAQAAAAVAAAAVEPTRLASGRVRQVSPEPHFRFHKPHEVAQRGKEVLSDN